MSYLVLARKYRPQTFADVVGQAHVTRTLANAIAVDRVAHAYLFCGPRGVGKTTAARLLAKRLNCETRAAEAATGKKRALDPEPCNTCSSCQDITAGRSLDVLEIDGASNRGIDEIRQLRENTRYAADEGRVKLYIIDEVHMLTKEAFNALLKTLEEPPPRVIFVLATTDPFKVPATILSRCQRFDFARLSSKDIAEHLGQVLKAEGIEAAPEALSLLARRAQGGVRDALSLLDQVIAAAEGPIDRPAVEAILGLVGDEMLFTLVDAIAAGDAAGAIRQLGDLYGRGADLEDVTRALVDHLRSLFLLAVGKDLEELLEVPGSELPRYREQAGRFRPGAVSELLEQASRLVAELKWSGAPRIAVELTLAEMAQAATRIPIGDVLARLEALENRLSGDDGGGDDPDPAPARGSTPSRGRAPAAPKPDRGRVAGAPVDPGSDVAVDAPPPRKGDPGDPGDLWAGTLDLLKGRRMMLWTALASVEPLRFRGDGALVLRVPDEAPMARQMLREPEDRDLLMDTLGAAGAAVPRYCFEEEDAGVASAPAPAAPAPEEDTRSMGELFREEPMIQKVIDMFDGEVLP